MPDTTAAGLVTTRYGFLLVPEYSMMAFTAAVDQIRMANRLSGKKLYEWVVMTEDGAPVCASNALSVPAVAMQESAAPGGVWMRCSCAAAPTSRPRPTSR